MRQCLKFLILMKGYRIEVYIHISYNNKTNRGRVTMLSKPYYEKSLFIWNRSNDHFFSFKSCLHFSLWYETRRIYLFYTGIKRLQNSRAWKAKRWVSEFLHMNEEKCLVLVIFPRRLLTFITIDSVCVWISYQFLGQMIWWIPHIVTW